MAAGRWISRGLDLPDAVGTSRERVFLESLAEGSSLTTSKFKRPRPLSSRHALIDCRCSIRSAIDGFSRSGLKIDARTVIAGILLVMLPTVLG